MPPSLPRVGCLVYAVGAIRPSQRTGDPPEDANEKPTLSIRHIVPSHQPNFDTATVPLTAKLGLPLTFFSISHKKIPDTIEPDQVVNADFSEALYLFSTGFKADTEYFGQPYEGFENFSYSLRRLDGMNLDPKHIEAMQAFVRTELADLLAYGKGGYGDEPETEEEQIAKQKAVEAVTKLTPENFTAFLQEYPKEKVAAGEEVWETVQPPSREGPLFCEVCCRYPTESDPLKVCAGCKSASYCGVECQEKDWKMSHKKLCKLAGQMMKKEG